MPIEKWSDSVAVAHLGDDPQFSEDLENAARLEPPGLNCVLDFSAVHFVNSSNIAALLRLFAGKFTHKTESWFSATSSARSGRHF